MNSHIAARGTRPVIATAIAAVFFGVVAVPCLAAFAPAVTPAVTAAVASPASPNGFPWD